VNKLVTDKDLKKWTKRLGLEGWRIVLKTDVHPNDMAIENSVGISDWTECSKTAVIQILGEQYYGNRIIPFDAEKTLVHELLHLKFSVLDGSGNDVHDRLLHQMIDDLARALVDAERSK